MKTEEDIIKELKQDKVNLAINITNLELKISRCQEEFRRIQECYTNGFFTSVNNEFLKIGEY
jgi:chaperonin cofactor prefoldin